MSSPTTPGIATTSTADPKPARDPRRPRMAGKGTQSTTVTAADASWERVIMPVVVVVAYTISVKATASSKGIATQVPGARRRPART
jgi:hypothetical protein